MDYKIKIKNINSSTEITRISNDAQGFVASLLLNNFKDNNIVFIAKNDFEIENIEKQIAYFAPHLINEFDILTFPAWDCLPYDRSSPKQIISNFRIKTLHKLKNFSNKKFILITTPSAIIQKIIPGECLTATGLFVKPKAKISINQIAEFLTFNGYQRQAVASDASEFAVRGGIIDIVLNKAATLIGYRIDFFGDEIESIKEFDPITQISHDHVKEVEILPASEVVLNEESAAIFREKYRKIFGANFSQLENDQIYMALSSQRSIQGMEHFLPLFYKDDLTDIFSYIKNSVLFFNQDIFSDLTKRHQLIEEYYKSRKDNVKESRISGATYNPIPPDLLYFSDKEISKKLINHTHIIFNNFESTNKDGRIIDLEIKPIPDFALAGRTNSQDPVELMIDYIKPKSAKKIIACLNESSQERIKKLCDDFNFKIDLTILPIDKGFETSDFIMIGEQAIFGEKIIRKKLNNKNAVNRILEEGLTINKGELVVHRNHGIGKFDGIHKIEFGKIKTDMLRIIYGGSDVLFVPVEDINLITRYGDDNPLIQLDRLGVAAWKNRKDKIRNRIRVSAVELIKIAAERHVRNAPVFIPDAHFYEEFKAKFGFVETDDQLRAINEIEEDLQKGSPMDRLVCGDVGFGKTEVAMRAAFIAASGNLENNQQKYQVAIITPTTLLCRQHYHNFTKRFAGTNLKIKQLSRLVTLSEAKTTKQELESGHVDIVIGTHALLNKNIKFKNLVLVIIDEEQHFGVAQKERLKDIRKEVHVLTLSATPIPRTLQMSLTGVKELSLIATPPIDRLAIRNFVIPFDSVIVREAIMREYQRSGKVFFVVPRISDIDEIEKKLAKLVPEVKVVHAHGQMTPSQLDKIMNDFYDGKIDVLLSTTIIESGIDIASANTIIIHKAEKFGLAQLYQLRGRVGRSKIRAYAYFLLSSDKLKPDAKKKLEVMQNLDDLGVGFTIASHDMDIRGSGDILGDEQSGHIKETGVELYQQLLIEEIERVKNRDESTHVKTIEEVASDIDFAPQIKLGVSLLIDENYISDLGLRMSFYKKIANVKNTTDQDNIKQEMIDRFGKMDETTNEEINNLMQISLLKNECKKLKIERLESNNDGILITFKDNKFKNPEKLLTHIFASKNKIKLQANQKLLFIHPNLSNQNKLDFSFQILDQLIKL